MKAESKTDTGTMAHHTECTPAQIHLFSLVVKTAESVNRSLRNQVETMMKWLTEQYGDAAPTFEQYRADQAALKFLAQARGLVDDQHVQKPFHTAVKNLYGNLPVSITAAATQRRQHRAAQPAKPAKAKAAPVTNIVKMPKDAETAARQMIAYYGMARVLVAFSQVLAEHRETAKEAKRLETLGQQYTVAHPEETVPLPRRMTH